MNTAAVPAAQPTNRASGAGTSAILCRGLGKAYRMYQKPIHRVWELLVPGLSKHTDFWAVRNVYLDIAPGSTVGIIGENGAGKSSLLKLLTGITRPTEGEVFVNGRVASLLELGAGFHPEFSGRDNIHLNCSILGMRPEEIDERFPKIVEFSELGDFIDRPVKTYSSGMYVRLGFSVAASVDPDILMIDEALSVGDEHFRGKCINRLNELREKGKTIVFVSHDMGAVKTMCEWVVLMDKGEVVGQGSAEKVADEYLKRAHERGNQRLSAFNRGGSTYPRWGSGEIEVHQVELLGAGGAPTHVFRTGDPFTVRMRFKTHRAGARQPVFGLGIYRSDGTHVNATNHSWRREPIVLDEFRPGEEGVAEVSLPALPLLVGQYYLTSYLYDHSKAAPTPIDQQEHVVTFEVIDADRRQHGMIHLPTEWRVGWTGPERKEERESRA
ncbi:MAG: ABC transporter ATP-binding protein [Planctomycetes bacterium]|nr:ABC transporter ATP-binding protein [Planctomycetota bacterium]